MSGYVVSKGDISGTCARPLGLVAPVLGRGCLLNFLVDLRAKLADKVGRFSRPNVLEMLQDLHDWLYHYNPTGGIPLKGTGIVVGLALLVGHLVAFLKTEQTQKFLKDFPRNYSWGVVLLTVDLLWGMLCMGHMDMGEFHTLRGKFLIIIPTAYVLVLVYVKEFLAVRALGALLLLVAGIVLQAAFLQPPESRLLLPIVAYAWIIAGLYFVGMPYLMRDGVNWITASAGRWKMATLGGIAYGAVTLLAAILWW